MSTVTLPITPNEQTLKLLIRARLFFEHAVGHSNINTELDRMIAIHNLDNSIEFALRIMARHLQIEEKTGKTFDAVEMSSLLGEINKFLKDNCNKELPYIPEIKFLRQLRNLVQHGIADPSNELQRLVSLADRFWNKTLSDIYGLSKTEIRYSSIIRSLEIRNLIATAEQHIDEKKYLDAIVKCRDAYENAKLEHLKNWALKISLVPALLEIKDNFQHLYRYLKEQNQQIENQKLNVDQRLFERFDDYLKHIPSEYCADSDWNLVMPREWTKEDAQFCYSFVTETITKWQSNELSPLYEVDKEYSNLKWIETLHDIELIRVTDGGCFYYFNEGTIKYFFIDKDTKELLSNLTPGKTYKLITKHTINNELEYIQTEFVKLVAVDFSLVTNSPPRWEAMIWTSSISMTSYTVRYHEGQIYSTTLDINAISTTTLKELGISENGAINIIAFKNQNIIRDIGVVPGLEEGDIPIIKNNFYSKPYFDELSNEDRTN